MGILRKTFRLNAETQIPAVGFGTYLIDEADVSSAVHTAIGAGYRHIDTAAVYRNEAGVGRGIKAAIADHGLTREEIFVTTKLWPGAAEWGETPKTYAETFTAFDESVKRLGLDYIDLYLIHSPHGGARRVEEWRALIDLKKAGKVRSVGVSNFTEAHINEIKAAGLALPEANQIELHPWSQKPDLVGYMHEHTIAPIAYSSLAPLSTWRAGQESAKPEAEKKADGVFATMAAKYGVTEAQLLLHWGVQNGYAILPKSLNPERMKQNLALDGFEIDAEDMDAIRKMDRGAGIAWSMGDPTKVS